MFLFARMPRLYLIILIALLGAVSSPLLSGAITRPGAAQEKSWASAGRDLLEKGEYELAIAHFTKQLGRSGTGDRDKLEIFQYLALLYLYADRNSEAIGSNRRALELASSLSIREDMSSIEGELAVQELYSSAIELRAAGNMFGSNPEFEKAWLKCESIGNKAYGQKILRSWSSNYLGSLNTMNRYLELNVQALNLAQSLNHRVEACRAAGNIGVYYSINNAYSYALSYQFRSLFYARDIPFSKDAVICLNNIASIYLALGDLTKAKEYFSDAIKRIDPEQSGHFQTSLLINLGQSFQALARDSQDPEYYSQALECFSSYLELERASGGMDFRLLALNGIAGIYVDQDRLDAARALLLPVLDKIKRDKTSALSGITFLNLATIALKKGNYAEAETYYREAQKAAKRRNNVLQLVRSAYGLGLCSERRNDYGQAFALFNDALEIIGSVGSRIANDTDRAEFTGRSREPFQALIELCYKLSLKGPLRAFERELFRVSESYRARSFMEYLAKCSRRKDAVPPDDSGRLILDKLRGERLTLMKELSRGAANQTGTEGLQSRIKYIDDMLDAAVFDKQLQVDALDALTLPVSLDILQNSLLADRTALVEYLLGDERSYLICVTKNSFHLIPLPSAQSVQDSLVAYLSFLEDPSIPASKGLAAAQRLYADLFLPAEGFIPASVDQLIIVPDGILFRLPFETLAFPGKGNASPVGCLNDRYAISYVPAASALFYLARKPKVAYTKEVLAFGVAEYSEQDRRSAAEGIYSAAAVLDELYKRIGFVITPIPHALKEMVGLAKRVPPEKAALYSGHMATEAAFKRLDLESYRLIHLACHAFSDDRYPLRSSLVFSPGSDDTEDGFLQVSEMYNMQTNADLVVMSACQTGRGKIVRNEGILGLPRIFFYMGARSVISTLWPVHDKAGAVFMDYFYDAYFQGAGKARALQIAKRKMADTKYRHPYYWASYTLTGEF